MEFCTPFIMPLSDSITFSCSNCVTVKSKDQRPILAAMTPAKSRLTEIKDSDLALIAEKTVGSDPFVVSISVVRIISGVSVEMTAGTESALINLERVSLKGETVKSKGLPGMNTETTHKMRQESCANPEMSPVRTRPHFRRSQVNATVPMIPVMADAPIKMLRMDPLSP